MKRIWIMAIARVHVNKQFIAMNAKDGRRRPVYTIKCRGKTRYARGFTCTGVLNGVTGKLACGAKAWLECDSDDLVLHDEMSFEEAKNA
jgi:hypothetical protein